MQKCPSRNKNTTRTEKKVLVLHVTLGGYEESIQHLQSPSTQASTHYIISLDGRSCEMVPVKERAWHAGKVWQPSNRFKRVSKYFEGKNPNEYCVGIELEGYAGHIPSSEQAKELVRIVVEELGDRFEDKEIITHHDIASYKPKIERVRLGLLLRLKLHRLKKELIKLLKGQIRKLSDKLDTYEKS